MPATDIINYTIRFLLGDDLADKASQLIGYTADTTNIDNYKLVIVASDFFHSNVYGTLQSLPTLPLKEIDGLPLLFGTDKPIERRGDTIILHADLVASAYFLLSRYEEYIRRDVRDIHGRFPGRQSLPFRAGFIHRPIVDEYRIFIRKLLRSINIDASEIQPQIARVFLTHDLDSPTLYTTWKGAVRSLLNGRGLKKTLKSKFGSVEDDEYYTFPWLFAQDESIRQAFGNNCCEKILFVRAGGRTAYDKPYYHLDDALIRKIIADSKENNYTIGLHASYASGINPKLVAQEYSRLSRHLGAPIRWNRNHYLDQREPEDMEQLIKIGITDDFTIGYADVAGFRLGTCYPVRYINPKNQQVSDTLTLHPLEIMDCTLSGERYMNLDYEQALQNCIDIAQKVNYVGGELILLWHNSELRLAPDSYHRRLYKEFLNQILHKYS